MEKPLPAILNEIRRRNLTRYTVLAMLAYQVFFVVVSLSKVLAHTGYDFTPLMVCYLVYMTCSSSALVMVRFRNQITKSYIFFILHFQSVICILVAIYIFYEVSDKRYLVLVACQVILMFVFIQSTLRVSLIAIFVVVSGYLAASYVGIYHSGQPGTFSSEILYTLIFIPVCVFIAYMSKKMQDQRKEIKRANSNLKSTYAELESHSERTMESIRYAEMIQRALLPGIERIKVVTPDSMFIWMPKDIVGGDIFYTYSDPEGSIIALMDCTGHGVAGAFLTMIVHSEIRKIILDEGCRDPSEILTLLGRAVKNILYKNKNNTKTDDGLDAAISFIDHSGSNVTYAGARIPLFYVEYGNVHRITGDKQSIGYKDSIDDYDFTNHVIHVDESSSFYMVTDGYTDQLGGEKRLRFGTKRFKQLILEYKNIPITEQRKNFLEALAIYQGENDQMDDITLIGFRL